MNSKRTEEILGKLRETGIIPVIVLDSPDDAEPLGRTLLEGGLPAAEITFRTDAAEEAIRILSRKCPELLLGAGTVLTPEQADRAAEAGASFIVSPGFDPETVRHCLSRDIPVCPGIQTPSELMQAVNAGLDHVKFFPSESAGGLGMINAMGAAFPSVRFMPTGGIRAENVAGYLKSERIFCCGGSWMVKRDLVRAGRFDRILGLVREAAEIVKEARSS